jgi:hypothetical protein|tara:strand:+ start:3857 stop:4057 length:201 start_codon:yes stop_codon:yes gene_type:complete
MVAAQLCKDGVMTWYIWLFILLVLGSIVGGLMVLLRTAKPLPLSEEQLTKIHQREREQAAKDADQR